MLFNIKSLSLDRKFTDNSLANKLRVKMITQNEIARKDFDRVCELNGYESFTEKQVISLSTHIKGLIEKSNREQLAPDEIQSIHSFNEDIPELKKAVVLNNDMTREVVFYRERQVIFGESIEKSEDGDIMKARGGVYANTAQNRKAGRVGQKYGGKKAEGEEKESKEKKSEFKVGDSVAFEGKTYEISRMSDDGRIYIREDKNSPETWVKQEDLKSSKKEATEKKEGNVSEGLRNKQGMSFSDDPKTRESVKQGVHDILSKLHSERKNKEDK